MTRYRLTALIATMVILLFAGVGHSGQAESGRVTMVSFDKNSNIIAGVPDGVPAVGWYQRQDSTVYVPGVVQPKFPPSPCKILTRVWNRVIAQFPPSVQRKALTAIIQVMAQHQCAADMVRDPANSPQDIMEMAPAP